MTREREDIGAFAPRGDVLASVHDRARAAAAAARIGADAELRAAVAAADVTPPPRASDRVEHASLAVPAEQALPRTTASKVKIDPDAVAIQLPAGRVDDETIAPHRAARSGGERMAQPITTPGLGGSTGGSAPGGAESESHEEVARAAMAGGEAPDGGPARVASSIDEAMLDAELKVAEQKNREVFEREKRRRIVDEQTRGKLARVEKGSKEHFEVLALRQKWTLPLDDADYKLWMQNHLLAQHAGALAEEASQQRIDKAKRVARGPVIALAAVAVLGAVAALGWWVRGSDVAPEGAAPSSQATGAGTTVATSAPAAATADATAAARAEPGAAPAASGSGGEPMVRAEASAPGPAEGSAPGPGAAAATGTAAAPARPGATGGGAAATAPAGPRPPAPGGKKDIWEREF